MLHKRRRQPTAAVHLVEDLANSRLLRPADQHSPDQHALLVQPQILQLPPAKPHPPRQRPLLQMQRCQPGDQRADQQEHFHLSRVQANRDTPPSRQSAGRQAASRLRGHIRGVVLQRHGPA